MPLSSNAPFNEFGQSMILRDIEQLYLITGGGQAPSAGSVGEGGAQESQATLDQTTQGGGGPASPVTTGSGSSSLSLPVSVANGGTGATTATAALRALGGVSGRGSQLVTTTGAGTFVVPSGVHRLRVVLVGAEGGIGGNPTIALDVVGYMAASSGGAVTRSFGWMGQRQYGAPGAFGVCEIDTSPGDSISYSVGAGGAAGSDSGAGTAGSAGGSTSITYGSLVITAAGGFGGDKARSVANASISVAPSAITSVTGGSLATYNGWLIAITSPSAPINRPLFQDGIGNTYPSAAVENRGGYQLTATTTGTVVGGGGTGANGAILFLY